MKIQNIVLAATLAAAIAPQAVAVDFGLPKLGKSNAASSGNVDADIKSFLQTADEARQLTGQSALSLGQALLTKTEMEAAEAALAAANAIADPKEKEAAKAKVVTDVQAQLAKVDFDAAAKELAKANDKKKNALVGNSMFNFVLGLLKDKELASRGSALASSAASNPMLLAKAGQVKDVLSSLSSQMGDMGKIATGLQKMATTIKSVPLPTSASAAPVAIAD
ncbi:hypothetical protein QPK31_08160 [Massilia sp. YIM B02769]|uniref:hypothetical protein n=1 Tax=unclassified Massilia TaxID=2609279 RepID=UPI0025B6934B|nr:MULTISPECIES: hypothetical protein [unclassified Massilia]MDN4058204.1 hypothetical protein [Massilia sp. YIM B02769]